MGSYSDLVAGFVDQLGSVLERALTKKDKEKDVAHVDLGQELTSRGLDMFFVVDTWPPSMAVSVWLLCVHA